jgi:hypothetical protein
MDGKVVTPTEYKRINNQKVGEHFAPGGNV